MTWLAEFAATYTRGWRVDGTTSRLRQKTELLRVIATIVVDRNCSERDLNVPQESP